MRHRLNRFRDDARRFAGVVAPFETPASIADACRAYLVSRAALRDFRALTRSERRSVAFYEREDALHAEAVACRGDLAVAIGRCGNWFVVDGFVVRAFYVFGDETRRVQVERSAWNLPAASRSPAPCLRTERP